MVKKSTPNWIDIQVRNDNGNYWLASIGSDEQNGDIDIGLYEVLNFLYFEI
jgi:hypothetical protein